MESIFLSILCSFFSYGGELIVTHCLSVQNNHSLPYKCYTTQRGPTLKPMMKPRLKLWYNLHN